MNSVSDRAQQVGLTLFAIVWRIYRTAPRIASDNCSNFILTHAGGWGIFAVGGLFLTVTAGLLVMQNPFFPMPRSRKYHLGLCRETGT